VPRHTETDHPTDDTIRNGQLLNIEWHLTLPIELCAHIAIDRRHRSLLHLVIRIHVMQAATLHPIGCRCANGLIPEGNQIDHWTGLMFRQRRNGFLMWGVIVHHRMRRLLRSHGWREIDHGNARGACACWAVVTLAGRAIEGIPIESSIAIEAGVAVAAVTAEPRCMDGPLSAPGVASRGHAAHTAAARIASAPGAAAMVLGKSSRRQQTA